MAIELLRRGYEVYAGVLYKKETGFVAIRRGEKLYIQVAGNIQDPETFNREIDPLRKIKDSYLKLILARTFQDEYQDEGIKIKDLSEWLLEGEDFNRTEKEGFGF